MKELSVKKGHYGYSLEFTIRDQGELMNFTGYALKLKVWIDGAISTEWELAGSSVEAGKVLVAVAVTDFDVEGSYLAEVEWTSDTVKDGTETFQMKVLPSL